MWKSFGLLSGCGLLVASVWLVSQIRAQEVTPPNPWAQPGAAPGADPSGANPFSRSVPSAPQEAVNVGRLRVDDAMRQAHRALEAGDLPEALRQARRADDFAREWHITFAPGEETPAQLAAQLTGSDPTTSLAADGLPQSELKLQATRLVAEADAALRAGDLDSAFAKATEAANLNVAFDTFEMQPYHILSEIARLQQASPNGPSRDYTASWAQTQPSTQTPPATAFTPSTPRTPANEARELISLARHAMQAGHLDQARTLALRAQEMNIAFDLLEDSPENVLREIEQLSGVTVFSPGGAETVRSQALQLLAEARQLLQAGQLAEARQRAEAAESLDATYLLEDERPDLVLQAIRVAESNQLTTTGTGSSPWAASTTPAAQLSVEDQNILARQLMSQAEAALGRGDLAAARTAAEQATQYSDNVTYELFEKSPDILLTQVAALEASRGNTIAQVTPTQGPFDVTSTTSNEYFAPGFEEAARPDALVIQTDGHSALELFNMGTQYLRDGNRDAAYQVFLAAYQSGETLDPYRQSQLEDKIQQLSSSDVRTASNLTADGGLGFDQPSPLDSEITRQSLVFDRLRTETMNSIFHAERLRDSDPEQALRMLEEQLNVVQNSELTAQQSAPLVRQIQSARSSMEAYATQRAPLLELQHQNDEVMAGIERDQAAQMRMEQELATVIDEFNDFMEQRRFPEAHRTAAKAMELDPTNPVSVQAFYTSQLAMRVDNNERLQGEKEEMFWNATNDVEWSLAHAIPSDANPLIYGDTWEDIIRGRKPSPIDNGEHSEAEERVRESLHSPVSLHFDNAPLSQVMQHISDRYGINVNVEEVALNEVGATASEPVSIHVDDITLRSALNLILDPLELSHVIDNEVLMITSQLRQHGDMVITTYSVGDLVVPITTRASDPHSWLQPGTGYGMPDNGFGFGGFSGNPMVGGMQQIPLDPLAPLPGMGGGSAVQSPKPIGSGTEAGFDALIETITGVVGPDTWSEIGGQGTIDRHSSTLSLIVRQTQAVHQEIRDLLEQLRRLQDLQVTIEVRFITVSDSFFEQIGIDFDFNVQDNVGGPVVDDLFNPISPFGSTDPVNGVQGAGAQGQGGQAGQQQQGGGGIGPTAPFGAQPTLNIMGRDSWPNRTVVGLAAPNTFSGDLDIPFRQGSFDLGAPQFGGFDSNAGITFGMAILSDLEAFLFVRAAQGDRRSNLMFAPKITLFNGQAGSISTFSLQPFVISVTPVASAFAIGFQPQIVTIPDGIQMSVAAVVSADRRYVRLSVQPFFTNITDVFTFSFIGGVGGGGQGGGGQFGGGGGGGGGQFGQFSIPDPQFGTMGGGGIGGGQFAVAGSGRSFGTQGQGQQGQGQGGQQNQGGGAGTVTIQQPVVSVVSVDTVVSVPDGGTVLLGGVKTLREGRNMNGVPILNKIPYVSRLFKNTGVGRETESLMMMVTPRIIIQEELENALFGPEN